MLALSLSACNANQNRGRGGMMGGRGMGGGMMQRSDRGGQTGMNGSQNGRSEMQGGVQQNGQQNYGQQSAQPLTPERARSMAQQYLESTGNTGFILGKGTETNSDYEFPLLTRSDSSRAASLMVNKQTGAVSSRQ